MPRRDIDPYGNFRFVLEIENITAGGFSECAGLQMEVKAFEYKEGGNNKTTLKFPEHASYGNVTLKRGVTLSIELIDWQLQISQAGLKDRHAVRRNLAIILRDEAGRDVRRWNLIRAFPVKWTGPDLKANASEIAIESLEIAHEGIQIINQT
jgi:phage tail-like protein